MNQGFLKSAPWAKCSPWTNFEWVAACHRESMLFMARCSLALNQSSICIFSPQDGSTVTEFVVCSHTKVDIREESRSPNAPFSVWRLSMWVSFWWITPQLPVCLLVMSATPLADLIAPKVRKINANSRRCSKKYVFTSKAKTIIIDLFECRSY